MVKERFPPRGNMPRPNTNDALISDTRGRSSPDRELATATALANNNTSTETRKEVTGPNNQSGIPRNTAEKGNNQGSNKGDEDAPPNQTAAVNDRSQKKRRTPTRSSHNLNERTHEITQETTFVNHEPIGIPATRTISPSLARRTRATGPTRGNEMHDLP